MRKGIWHAIGAYFTWGLFPIYWKWLSPISAFQLIGHRIVWSCVLLLGLTALFRQWSALRAAAWNGRVLRIYGLAAVLIGFNWSMYVWAVNAGFIVETSLGYFINPLISVLLGVFVLGEKLRVGQWISIGLAATGVLYLAMGYGSLPWISLSLAFTFGLYGLVKKTAPLGAVPGLALETALLFLPATVYLIYLENEGRGAFLHQGMTTDILLVGAGLVTTLPLLLFASAAQRIPLSLIGLLQYMAPTLQFLLGVFVYREPFSSSQLVGFTIVWIALAFSALEGVWAARVRVEAAGPIPS
jgi:chloramphenicol-sensitive protein RarD